MSGSGLLPEITATSVRAFNYLNTFGMFSLFPNYNVNNVTSFDRGTLAISPWTRGHHVDSCVRSGISWIFAFEYQSSWPMKMQFSALSGQNIVTYIITPKYLDRYKFEWNNLDLPFVLKFIDHWPSVNDSCGFPVIIWIHFGIIGNFDLTCFFIKTFEEIQNNPGKHTI